MTSSTVRSAAGSTSGGSVDTVVSWVVSSLLSRLNHRGGQRIPPPEMSPAGSTTPHMQQIPPQELPGHTPDSPARPTVIPMLPTRVQQPGRQAPLPDAVAVRRCAVPETAPPFDADTPPATRQDATNIQGPEAVTPAAARARGRPGAASSQAAPDHAETALAVTDLAETDPAESGVPATDVPDTGVPATRRPPPGPPDGWPSQFAQVLAETLAGLPARAAAHPVDDGASRASASGS